MSFHDANLKSCVCCEDFEQFTQREHSRHPLVALQRAVVQLEVRAREILSAEAMVRLHYQLGVCRTQSLRGLVREAKPGDASLALGPCQAAEGRSK